MKKIVFRIISENGNFWFLICEDKVVKANMQTYFTKKPKVEREEVLETEKTAGSFFFKMLELFENYHNGVGGAIFGDIQKESNQEAFFKVLEAEKMPVV